MRISLDTITINSTIMYVIRNENAPAENILLVFHELAHRFAQLDLHEALQLRVDMRIDAVREASAHGERRLLHALDHSDHFRQCALLFRAVVVLGRLLVVFRFRRRMRGRVQQLPRELHKDAHERVLARVLMQAPMYGYKYRSRGYLPAP